MACSATAPSGRNRCADKQEKVQSAANGSEQHDNAFDRKILIKKEEQNGNKIHSTGTTKGQRDVASILHTEKVRASSRFAST